MFLSQAYRETHLKRAFCDSCNNEKNANLKELLLLIEDYLMNNIARLIKLNLFFIKTES